ncbi:E3 ubiquitin-protein ligase HEL1-like isoform X2 [Gigantopelta aegis]|nr:E3 ubiquitin-protein ligase HEL1-like isoform X2 [Gigantopelta aegis]
MLLQNGDEHGKPMPASVTFFVNVKPCPKCHYPMEKDGGCSHMTCKCTYHFCWECLGDWNDHMQGGLICSASRRKPLQNWMLEDSMTYTLRTLYYKKSVHHRHKRLTSPKTFSVEQISTYVQLLAAKRKPNHMNFFMSLSGIQADSELPFKVFKIFNEAVIYVKEINMLLENVFVLLSNTTRSMNCRSFLGWISRLQFVCAQIEEMVSFSIKEVCNQKDRLQHMMELAEKLVRIIVRDAPKIREKISQHKQKQAANISEGH